MAGNREIARTRGAFCQPASTYSDDCHGYHRRVFKKPQVQRISRILENTFAVMQAPSHKGA